MQEEEEFYKLPSCNKTGHVVAPEYLLVQQAHFFFFSLSRSV